MQIFGIVKNLDTLFKFLLYLCTGLHLPGANKTAPTDTERLALADE